MHLSKLIFVQKLVVLNTQRKITSGNSLITSNTLLWSQFWSPLDYFKDKFKIKNKQEEEEAKGDLEIAIDFTQDTCNNSWAMNISLELVISCFHAKASSNTEATEQHCDFFHTWINY